jgi:hypothetical protein
MLGSLRSLSALGMTMGLLSAAPALAVPTDGTYTGTISAGGTVTIQVSGGQVTSFGVNSYTAGCATVSGSMGPCSTIGNNFTCGQTFCAPDGAPRLAVSGTFSGNSVAGDFDFSLQGPAIPIPPPCCTRSNVAWSATRQGGGPTPGSLRFSVATQSVQEGGGAATVTVQRTGGSSGAVSVHYASADGSAIGGSDYTPVSGTLNWGSGDAAAKSFQVPILDDGDVEGDDTVSLALSAPTGGAALGTPSTQTLTILDDDSVEPGPCVEDDHTLCLLDGRFRVEVVFTPPGGVEQPANAIPFTDRAGMFWFFNENNIEMLVKMQNACIPQFNRFWVFFGATTNVEFHVTVTDTDAVLEKHYDNPQGMVALPVADTQAFATCP